MGLNNFETGSLSPVIPSRALFKNTSIALVNLEALVNEKKSIKKNTTSVINCIFHYPSKHCIVMYQNKLFFSTNKKYHLFPTLR